MEVEKYYYYFYFASLTNLMRKGCLVDDIEVVVCQGHLFQIDASLESSCMHADHSVVTQVG